MTTISRTSSSRDSRFQWLHPLQYPAASSIRPGRGAAPGGRRGSSPAKNIAKVGRDAAFSAILFVKRRALSDLGLRKGDVRPHVSAIVTAKTVTKKRKNCHKCYRTGRTGR